jgi:hypothetical protein
MIFLLKKSKVNAQHKGNEEEECGEEDYFA